MQEMEVLVEKAQQAFFIEVAKNFPQIQTGDFPPEAQLAFDVACRQAIETWIAENSN